MKETKSICPSCNNAIVKSCKEVFKINNAFMYVCNCGETFHETELDEKCLERILWSNEKESL